MITFLRKIRRSLLRENKVSKYLLYALGEIVLVVIGILIALQINNWNEERKARQALHTILREVYENLLSDQQDLEYSIEEYQDFVKNLEILMERGVTLPQDSLAQRISDVHRATSFLAQDFGYAKLSNNATTQRLPKNLTSSLARYYAQYRAQSLSNTSPEFLSLYSVNALRDYLIEYGFPIGGLYMEPVKNSAVFLTIIEDPEFLGILRNTKYTWDIHKMGFDDAIKQVNGNLQLLEEYFISNDMSIPERDQ